MPRKKSKSLWELIKEHKGPISSFKFKVNGPSTDVYFKMDEEGSLTEHPIDGMSAPIPYRYALSFTRNIYTTCDYLDPIEMAAKLKELQRENTTRNN